MCYLLKYGIMYNERNGYLKKNFRTSNPRVMFIFKGILALHTYYYKFESGLVHNKSQKRFETFFTFLIVN
jgi:hypothetical protein